ncbi:MAG: antibiotic biosynthesis monooxygenase family protein [Leptospirales bacterium]
MLNQRRIDEKTELVGKITEAGFVLGEYRGVNKATGKSMQSAFAHVYRICDSLIVRFLGSGLRLGLKNETTMILEVARLTVRAGESAAFEQAFSKAQNIISSMPGYVSHELQRCLESKDTYLLLVQWQRLEDHTIGFRQSRQYQDWKKLLHHFYDPFPTVEHYEPVFISQHGIR